MLTSDRQLEHLNRVSRSFALTIPLLPLPLADWVGNAYLLCRIADTLEDAPELDIAEKKRLMSLFLAGFENPDVAFDLPAIFSSQLAAQIPDVELLLLQDTADVLARMRTFPSSVQQILHRAILIMSEGMSVQQDLRVNEQIDLDRYCYAVAGVVGELLYFLFAEQVSSIQAKQSRMLPLALSFGLGLQLTNILKDIWDDASRGVCWVPDAYLQAAGISREQFLRGELNASEQDATLSPLLALGAGHLDDALRFTLDIPSDAKGIRQFCLWAIALAWLTLTKISGNPEFRSVNDVKISRRELKQAIMLCRVLGWSNSLTRLYFAWLGRKLPRLSRSPQLLHQTLSRWVK